MKIITVSVSATAKNQARVRAAGNDLSISEVVRYALERLPSLAVARASEPNFPMPSSPKSPHLTPRNSKGQIGKRDFDL